jgi:hypothetical protein
MLRMTNGQPRLDLDTTRDFLLLSFLVYTLLDHYHNIDKCNQAGQDELAHPE